MEMETSRPLTTARMQTHLEWSTISCGVATTYALNFTPYLSMRTRQRRPKRCNGFWQCKKMETPE